MEILNGDAGVDELLDSLAVDARPIEILAGSPFVTSDAMQLLFKGIMRSFRSAGRDVAVLEIDDNAWSLEKPAQDRFYAGDWPDNQLTLEGDESLRGRPKPQSYGRALNIPAVLVNPTLNVWQVHDGIMQGVDAVYDLGIAFTFAGDFPDIRDAAAAPPAGCFTTQASGGYFRLAGAPQGAVTADVRGDAAGGAFLATAAGIAFRCLRDRWGWADDAIDTLSFSLTAGAAAGDVGLHLSTEEISRAAVLDALFAGIGGWWGIAGNGLMTAGILEAPAASAKAAIAESELIDLAMLEVPAEIDPAIWRVRVGYRPNWSPLSPADISPLLASEDPARWAWLQRERLYAAPLTKPELLNAHAAAKEITFDSLFVNESDAQGLAARLLALYGGRVRLASARTPLAVERLKLGWTVNVTHSRYGLSQGRNAVVVGIGIDAQARERSIDFLWVQP